MIAYNQHYYQRDIYLHCHALLAAANKSIPGYVLRNTDNRQPEGSDTLVKDSGVGPRSQRET